MSRGYGIVVGRCVLCREMFGFNPDRVPSIITAESNGQREPVCKTCLPFFNEERERLGLPVLVVLEGSYSPSEGMP